MNESKTIFSQISKLFKSYKIRSCLNHRGKSMEVFPIFLCFFLTLDYHFKCILSSFPFLCRREKGQVPNVKVIFLAYLVMDSFFSGTFLSSSLYTFFYIVLSLLHYFVFSSEIHFYFSFNFPQLSLLCYYALTGINRPSAVLNFINHTFLKYWHPQELM